MNYFFVLKIKRDRDCVVESDYIYRAETIETQNCITHLTKIK